MNIHEYQAKELMRACGVPIPAFYTADTPEEAVAAMNRLGGVPCVVKAQIHSGGRGKAGGVKLSATEQEAAAVAAEMLGKRLVTAQTGESGRIVRRLMVTEAVSVQKEYYAAFIVDAAHEKIALIVSGEGGMEIEQIAKTAPDKIATIRIDPLTGFQTYHALNAAIAMGLPVEQRGAFSEMLHALYGLFTEKDCSLLEINPLALLTDGRLVALDAKMRFDDNALLRHPDEAALLDPNEEDANELAAKQYDLNYISLFGDIGCLVNGAGLAMATMDTIRHFGGDPANFLDVGGGASGERVAVAIRLILSDPKVRGIIINIFGGVTSCAAIADGLIEAAGGETLRVPLVIRLDGTEVELGRQKLRESGLSFTVADTLSEACRCMLALLEAKEAHA